MKLKICGMKNHQNIQEIANLKPDFLGFIFYEKSVRYFDGTLPKIENDIKKVGVFVNQSIDEIFEKISKYKLDFVQLHGEETPDFCIEIQKKAPVIKAFSVNNDFNMNILEQYENATTHFLFDTKGDLPGGNGTTFNWKILEKYTSSKPFFISGGIGIPEIEALKKSNLPIFAIDINSKFETQPGQKNIMLCREATKLI
jgi:phosphoribosylanthranilate isomerase